SVDRLAEYALPRHGHQPDREVVGRLVGRLRSVRIAAGKVEAVSGFEGEIEQWVAELVEARWSDRVLALHRIGGARQRRPDAPPLRAAELDHEHVVEVEVQVQSTRARR